ncbi:MAG: hypothetical protein R3F34_11585 [Planctomycetota bacterium]
MTDHANSIGPWDGRLECALRLAAPSFSHRLANALAPVVGFASVAVREGVGLAAERTVLVHDQAERAIGLMRSWSEVAKPTEGEVVPLDLVAWLAAQKDFLSGCIESLGSSLELDLQVDAAPVDAATRPLSQVLFVALVEAAASGGGRMRIGVAPDGEGSIALELVSNRSVLAIPEGIVERSGASVCSRARDDAHATLRLLFTLRAAVASTRRPDAPLVVLVERDPFMRELVEQVLIEQGYRVSAHERAEQWGGAEDARALLVDSVTASTPAVASLLERAGGMAPVAVMGRATAPLDRAWPQLAKPFRPGELLDCVASLVRV